MKREDLIWIGLGLYVLLAMYHDIKIGFVMIKQDVVSLYHLIGG